MENIHSLWFPPVITEFGGTLEQKNQHFAFQIIALHLCTCQVLRLLLGEKLDAEVVLQQRPWGIVRM